MKLQPQKPTSAGVAGKEGKPRNYVHDNIIRAENIKKESHHLQKNRNENFQLNPYNFYPHYEKPTKVNPWYLKQREAELKSGLKKLEKEDTYLECYTDDPILESISTSNVLRTLKNPTLVPRQKSARPMTANQEIGWFAQPYNTFKPRETHGVKSDPITKWNGSYCVDHKINPFKSTDRSPFDVFPPQCGRPVPKKESID